VPDKVRGKPTDGRKIAVGFYRLWGTAMKQAQEGQAREKDDKVCLNVSRAIRDALKLSATARGITLGEYVNEIITGKREESK
jgi:hypothetical protein